MNYFEKRVKISAEKKEKVLFYLYVLFVFIFLTISGKIINDLGIYNIGIGYKYNFNDLSKSVNLEERNKFLSATAEDALNFIANFDGTINELQNISNSVKDAYENHGLNKEYYDTFNASFNTYVLVNTHTQDNTLTTQTALK